MNSFLTGIRNILLWSYARGSWQYDLLCMLIILAVFLVPSRYFGDRDRPAPGQANSPWVFASKSPGSAGIGAQSVIIESIQLEDFLKSNNRTELMNDPQEAIILYLHARIAADATFVAMQPYTDSQGRTGYRVRYK
ncbi:MAG: hypothetical protein IPM55_07605 [Acidobacteria bacterium]|nr:hypothetical protein [Acidobacteriota bacterium]